MSTVTDDYRRFLSTMRGAAENTVSTYLREVTHLLDFLSSRNVTHSTAQYDDFLAWRESMHRKPRGVSLALASARSFYNFLEDRGILRPNPFPRSLTVKIKHQEPIDVPSAVQFLNCIRPGLEDTRWSRRDALTRRAIVETLAGTGLRIASLLTMCKRHLRIDEQRPYVIIDPHDMACKGRTAGAVPMSPYAAKVLREYLAAHPSDGPVFDMPKHQIRRMLHTLAPDDLCLKPHSLRHFYCSMTYFRNFDGGRNDIIWVRDAAGHSSVSTTDGYLKMARRVVQDDTTWEKWALVS